MQFSTAHCGHLGPLSTVPSVAYLKKTLNEKSFPYFAFCLISLGRQNRDCSILQAWLSVVGSTAGAVGIESIKKYIYLTLLKII
jgi:hypothetical protein